MSCHQPALLQILKFSMFFECTSLRSYVRLINSKKTSYNNFIRASFYVCVIISNFCRIFRCVNLMNIQYVPTIMKPPLAEFIVSICSTPKFICSLDDGVPRLLITESDSSYKSNIYKKKG